jgi:hypothetical protein
MPMIEIQTLCANLDADKRALIEQRVKQAKAAAEVDLGK